MRALAPAVACILSSGCLPLTTEGDGGPPLPPCVTAFHAGQTLTLRLGDTYDADSNYVFDSSFLRGGGAGCNGIDGLGPGATVTIDLGSAMPTADVAGWTLTCAPFGRFNPPSLANDSEMTNAALWTGEGITIAGVFTSLTFDAGPGNSIVGVFTPTKDPFGPLTPRTLPPLVVSRELVNEGFTGACFDAWVATQVSGP